MKGTITGVKPPGTLNIRDRGSMLGKIIGKIPNGADVEVLSNAGKWYAVEFNGLKGFSWGGYIRLETPKPARQPLAVLDPGHFKNHNRGAACGYWEGNAMLDYGFLLKAELEAVGWRVLLTRTGGRDLGLTARGKMAARNKADLFYSLHSNACRDPRVRRVTAFYSVDRPGDKAFTLAQAKTVAEVMGSPAHYACVRASTKFFSKPDPSVKEDYYTVIDAASDGGVPHVLLLEHDFHTNPDVCRWLTNPDNLRRMAKAEAECIAVNIK
jgi:N-acetylmuramoyl-L-alanine amidase